MWFAKKKETITESAPTVPFTERKKRTKIVVIDDDPNSFPSALLRNDGYTIEDWSSLDAAKLHRLENGDFDIIVLDIKGITDATLSDTGDGLGVIRRIKQVNPGQIVVAFSGSSYDVSKIPFWRQADEVLDKPVSLIGCKQLLDGLISTQITVGAYWQSVSRLLTKENVSADRIAKLEGAVVDAAKNRRKITAAEVIGIIGTAAKSATLVAGLVAKVIDLWP